MAMLEIRNVQKTFRTDAKPGLHAGIFHRPGARKAAQELQVLRGVDLTVEKGEMIALLGGNAAIAGGIRYLLVVLFAGCVWPLTFWWFSRLGKR